ncbi:MAG: hypothetical protein E7Z93_00675 [Cyanobacteria bacterium SIG32]|nr:hypothetical protein [Cyanobacteria bacterium SIG32]
MDLSYDELKQAYDDLSNNYDILQRKFHDALITEDALMTVKNEIIDSLQNANALLVKQYELVVKQNRNLQEELRKKDSGESKM